jgi:TatD DNase family protein
VEYLDEFPQGVYATVGLHPIHTSPSFHDEDESEGDVGGETFDAGAYRPLASHPKVVAIGECGLDYFRDPSDDEVRLQVAAFEAQIAFANELQKPLMLHLRNGRRGNAYKDAYDILKRQAKVLGNSHFFAGSLEDATRFWDMGYSTSFTGVITFTGDYDAVVKAAPADLIHAETDAPYVAPKPYRGQRNEPLHVQEVVARMAELRGETLEHWADRLARNAASLFSIHTAVA